MHLGALLPFICKMGRVLCLTPSRLFASPRASEVQDVACQPHSPPQPKPSLFIYGRIDSARREGHFPETKRQASVALVGTVFSDRGGLMSVSSSFLQGWGSRASKVGSEQGSPDEVG